MVVFLADFENEIIYFTYVNIITKYDIHYWIGPYFFNMTLRALFYNFILKLYTSEYCLNYLAYIF